MRTTSTDGGVALDQTAETPVVMLTDEDPTDRPREAVDHRVDDMMALAGTLVGSFALTWLLYTQVLPLHGVLGFVVSWYAVFLVMYGALIAIDNPVPIVIDRVVRVVITLAAALVGFALVTVVVYTVWRGHAALFHWNFYTQSGGNGPLTPLDKGGISHAIIGSFIQVGIAIVISLPLGLGTAIFMSEVGGWLARIVRTVVEAMTAVPDLLAGLFVYVVLILGFHMEKDGFAVGIALAVTMTPIIARSSEVVLRVVPGGLREASLALGASQWQTTWRVVLPVARPGLATALILAIARGIGESAPLLIVSGASSFYNRDPFKNTMNSLPLYIYSGARSGQHLLVVRAFGAATLLLAMVFALFAIARVLARQRMSR